MNVSAFIIPKRVQLNKLQIRLFFILTQLLSCKIQFEKRESPSSVKNAKISEDGVLTFDFTTPLGSIYVRNTAVKAIFRDKKLMVVWLSALTTFWEGEYGEKLNTIKDSFKLVDVVKRA